MVSQNRVRRHASPDRDDLGRGHDQSAVLPRGLGYLRLLGFPAPAGQLSQLPGAGGGRRPRVAPCDADGLAYGRARSGFGERNGCPASGVLPVWLMFLQHRMRCVSTIRWRASLTILAGVVLIAAEGRAS